MGRPYVLQRSKAEVAQEIKKRLTTLLGNEEGQLLSRQNRSLSKALEVLKEMKATGRTWAEMAARVETEFGTQLDRDQLKALVR